uniref:Uncharacterized protein n=1 Tax=Arion vulgaris TaxID=1028688 RepID=A0A0B7ANK7_9EUPU
MTSSCITQLSIPPHTGTEERGSCPGTVLMTRKRTECGYRGLTARLFDQMKKTHNGNVSEVAYSRTVNLCVG